MALPKRCDTTIVQELLAFVQNKLDVMDELSLEQICSSSFTEADILDAKKVLADSAIITTRLITRRRDALAGKKDLQDIFRVLKETDPDDVPTYVARDLSRLPPVTWDHVDVTRFMKDILQLREEVSGIRRKLDESERNVADLHKELATLRKNAASTIVSPNTSSRHVNSNRGGGRCDISSVSISPSANDTVSRADELSTDATPIAKTASSLPVQKPASLPPARPSKTQKKSYAQASRPSPAPTAPLKKTKTTLAPDLRKTDSDGFTLVDRRKSRQRRSNLNKRGTSTAPGLKAVEPTFLMYLSRVDPGTSEDNVHKFVQHRLGVASPIVAMQRLESTVRRTCFKSYVLRVPVQHKVALLSPDFWPKGLVFRRYWETVRETRSQKNEK